MESWTSYIFYDKCEVQPDTFLREVRVGLLTTHLLSVERAGWPKLHDIFENVKKKRWKLYERIIVVQSKPLRRVNTASKNA